MKTLIERDGSALFGWCREKRPHPRSIDAAKVSAVIYTRIADRLMLFWHLRERRVGRVLAGDNRIKLLFLATSSAGATRTTRTAKLRS
jgi:hypothetical protein